MKVHCIRNFSFLLLPRNRHFLKRLGILTMIYTCFSYYLLHLINDIPIEKYATVEKDWKKVISSYFSTAPISSFSAATICRHFHENENISRNVSVLVFLNSTFVHISTPDNLSTGKTRARSLSYVLHKIINEKRLINRLPERGVYFLVMLHDGHRPEVATLGSARHWKSWDMMIPVPLGNHRGLEEGWGSPIQGWDAYVKRNIVDEQNKYPWNSKIPKAVFRGALGMQRYTLGSCNVENNGNCTKARYWEEVNRGVLFKKSLSTPYLFDIGFTSFRTKSFAPNEQLEGAPLPVRKFSVAEFQRYQLVLNVGSNQDWAERLRSLLFMNSAVVIHQAETKEFFTPLLKPWVHYIPTNIQFSDLSQNVEWGISNANNARRISQNANKFAKQYISEESMILYWLVVIERFAKVQAVADYS